jgi:hypothetical protein
MASTAANALHDFDVAELRAAIDFVWRQVVRPFARSLHVTDRNTVGVQADRGVSGRQSLSSVARCVLQHAC